MLHNHFINNVLELDELSTQGYINTHAQKITRFFRKHNLTLSKKLTLVYEGKEIKEVINHFFQLGQVLQEADNYHIYRNWYLVLSNKHQAIFRFLINSAVNFTSINVDIYYPNAKRNFDYNQLLSKALDLPLNKRIVHYTMFAQVNDEKEEFSFSEVLQPETYTQAYPFIENLEQFIQMYLESQATILFFYGDPGTGKTHLIKKIIYENIKKTGKHKAYYAPEKTAAISPSIYFSFLRDTESNLLILEDLDNFLYAREEGNDFMSILLNTSDGLIKNQQKKVIITSNLSNLNDKRIDQALIRPGRCFSSVKFRKLSYEESCAFLQAKTKTDLLPLKEKSYSLAELYSFLEQTHNIDNKTLIDPETPKIVSV